MAYYIGLNVAGIAEAEHVLIFLEMSAWSSCNPHFLVMGPTLYAIRNPVGGSGPLPSW